MYLWYLIDAFQLFFIEAKISMYIDSFCFLREKMIKTDRALEENMLILNLVVLYYPPSGVYNIALIRLNMKTGKGKQIWFELKEWKE